MNTRALRIAAALALAGCATSRPILYPNAHYQSVGADAAEREISECRKLAETAGAREGPGAGGQVAGSTAAGAGIGAAGGAVGGAIGGSAGLGAAAGAAGGAVAGFLGGLFSRKPKPDAAYRNFVDRCLRERGYEPTGWQ
jgi:hypothetical protein